MMQQSIHSSSFEFIWGQYRIWTATSQKIKRELKIWSTTVLVLNVVASFTAILSQYLVGGEASMPLFWLSACAIAIAGYMGGKLLANNKEKIWLQTQAAAEDCKSHAFLYLLKVSPYNTANDDMLLFHKGQQLIKSLSHISQISLSKEEELKGIPDPTYSCDKYMKERILKQARGYYLLRAAQYRKLLKRASNLGRLLGVIGFLMVLFDTVESGFHVAAWIAFISTIAVSLISFMIANRYQYLSISYQATGTQLKKLWYKSSLLEKADIDALKDIVNDCEAVLAIENKTWMIDFTKEVERPSANQDIIHYAIEAQRASVN